MRYVYPAVLTPAQEGGFLVAFPDVPEAITDGDTREEALLEAADALDCAMGFYVEAREPIPTPSAIAPGQEAVALPALTAAKLALYSAMREQGVSNVALAERLGVTETVVRRLVHPDHQSKIERVERALAQLGKHLVVEAA
ncbi:MAG: type II toxin-antitoxin system HicB family antitoxin [Nitrococcus sp.]|nr:type II toxin-antitoxin system HicB family antitoxin [Nitrococcus sp.]